MEKYNAENPPEAIYMHFNKTAINLSEHDNYLPITIKYIKAPTEPVVPLSEVLNLLAQIEFDNNISLIGVMYELKQKYGVSE